MTGSWDERVDEFWRDADDERPDEALATMRALIGERTPGDPDALYEWASVHDFLGREHEAIPLYRRALDSGLRGTRRPQAVIQLASSLRVVGDAEAAVTLLTAVEPDEATGTAAQAFLALALHDLGRHDEALQASLRALIPSLPRYGGSLEWYAAELTARHDA